jgi:Ca2+-binding EF-hand superfamily protein
VCRAIDLDRRGHLTLLDFVAATTEPRVCREPRLARFAFRILDADADGFITQPDLEKILLAAPGGSADRARDAAAILASAGPDEAGRVSLERFCALLTDDADAAAALAREAKALGPELVKAGTG